MLQRTFKLSIIFLNIRHRSIKLDGNIISTSIFFEKFPTTMIWQIENIFRIIERSLL